MKWDNFLSKLGSRKLLVALATIIAILSGLPEETTKEVLMVVVPYILAQAAVDYKGAENGNAIK